MYFHLANCVVDCDTGTVFNNVNQHINLYGDDVEVDYRGYDVSSPKSQIFFFLIVRT